MNDEEDSESIVARIHRRARTQRIADRIACTAELSEQWLLASAVNSVVPIEMPDDKVARFADGVVELARRHYGSEFTIAELAGKVLDLSDDALLWSTAVAMCAQFIETGRTQGEMK